MLGRATHIESQYVREGGNVVAKLIDFYSLPAYTQNVEEYYRFSLFNTCMKCSYVKTQFLTLPRVIFLTAVSCSYDKIDKIFEIPYNSM